MIRPDFVEARISAAWLGAPAASLRLKFLISLIILMCHAGFVAVSARSAEIVTFIPEKGSALILVRGELAVVDGLRFTQKTDNIKNAIVRFESPGGMMIAGLGIGLTIRRKGFVTVVPPGRNAPPPVRWLGSADLSVTWGKTPVLAFMRPIS